MTQSARVPVHHERLLAAERPTAPPCGGPACAPCPAARRAPARRGRWCPGGCRRPGRPGARWRRGRGRPGWRRRPTRRRARATGCGPSAPGTMHISSSPAPAPPYLGRAPGGRSSPARPASTTVRASCRSAHRPAVRTISGSHSRSSAPRATSWSASCSSSYVKSTASPTPRGRTAPAPFPDTSVRVHGGRLPFPRGFCPGTRGREVPRRAARLARREPAAVPRSRVPRRRRQPERRGQPTAAPEVAAQDERGRVGRHPLGRGVRRAAPSTPCSGSSTPRSWPSTARRACSTPTGSGRSGR